MKLQQKILSHCNRRKVKCLAVHAIGLAGVTFAIMAVLFSQDQATMLIQMSQELSQSPVGVVISSLKSFF